LKSEGWGKHRKKTNKQSIKQKNKHQKTRPAFLPFSPLVPLFCFVFCFGFFSLVVARFKVEVDGDKRPKTSVTLLGTTDFTNPYEK
jgi:hypothetical protein